MCLRLICGRSVAERISTTQTSTVEDMRKGGTTKLAPLTTRRTTTVFPARKFARNKFLGIRTHSTKTRWTADCIERRYAHSLATCDLRAVDRRRVRRCQHGPRDHVGVARPLQGIPDQLLHH